MAFDLSDAPKKMRGKTMTGASPRSKDTSTRPRRITAAILTVLLVGALAMAPAPTGLRDATSPSESALDDGSDNGIEGFLPHLPAEIVEPAMDVASSADRLRAAVDEGGVGAVLRQVIQESGADLPLPELPAPTTVAELPGLAELSPSLRDPVAGLDSAVQQASALLGRVPLKDLHQMLRLEAAAWQDWMDTTADLVSPESGALTGEEAADRDQRMAAHTTLPLPANEMPPAIARAVANAPQAALLLAAAVDTYGPQLKAAVEDLPDTSGTTGPVEGCDLLDVPDDRLCVASELDNVHTDDYLLTIDLGGDDSYHNSAGGAPFVSTDDLTAQVSLLVDLSGDDFYKTEGELLGETTIRELYGDTHRTFFGFLRARVSSGAGIYGGVGMLVDREGDDTYAAHADSHGPGSMSGLYAQGSGRVGIGVLVDDSGHDVYEATGGDGAGLLAIAAQAASAAPCLGGLSVAKADEQNSRHYVEQRCEGGYLGGVLVDRSGDDRYLIDSGVAEGPSGEADIGGTLLPVRTVLGQSSSIIASAVLIDAAGSDIFDIQAAGRGPVTTDDDRAGVFIFVAAQSSSLNGTAWFLTGAGNTRYSTHVASTGKMLWQMVEAQSAAVGYGTSLLDDHGGDDQYQVISERMPHFTVNGSEYEVACCEGELLVVPSGPATTAAQGRATLAGVALLVDGAGDDEYLLRSETDLSVAITEANDGRELLVHILPWSNDVLGQGSSTNLGFGALLDAAGSDAYALELGEHVDVTLPTVDNPPSLRGRRYASMIGQGGATQPPAGVLLDLGGVRDRFSADLRMETAGPAGRAPFLQPGQVNTGTVQVQGAGWSSVFGAFGSEPLISASPHEPACIESGQPRGHGVWHECGGDDTPGVGMAPDAPVPTSGTTIEVAAEPVELRDDAEAHEQLDEIHRATVTARVVDPNGDPVVGRRLHFILTLDGADGRTGPSGARLIYVPATTDEKGKVVTTVPVSLSFYQFHRDHTQIEDFGVLVLFDGTPPVAGSSNALAPAHTWVRLEGS